MAWLSFIELDKAVVLMIRLVDFCDYGSVCLPSDALSQHLPSYLGFFYLGRGVSLHGCSSKGQPPLLTSDVGWLVSATAPDFWPGVAPLSHAPAPSTSISLSISLQFSSVTQTCPTLCDPMNRSTPGLPVHHQLLEFTQTHIHRVGDAIQPSHLLSSPSLPAPNPSQYRSFPMSQLFA